MRIKWVYLNDNQRNQILDYYSDEIKKRELFEHDLNKRSFPVNKLNGNVVFSN